MAEVLEINTTQDAYEKAVKGVENILKERANLAVKELRDQQKNNNTITADILDRVESSYEAAKELSKVLKDGGHAESGKMKAVEAFKKGLVDLIHQFRDELVKSTDEDYLGSIDALRVLSSISSLHGKFGKEIKEIDEAYKTCIEHVNISFDCLVKKAEKSSEDVEAFANSVLTAECIQRNLTKFDLNVDMIKLNEIKEKITEKILGQNSTATTKIQELENCLDSNKQDNLIDDVKQCYIRLGEASTNGNLGKILKEEQKKIVQSHEDLTKKINESYVAKVDQIQEQLSSDNVELERI